MSDDKNEGSEADVPLLAAKKLDFEKVVTVRCLREYIEKQGDSTLYYSLCIPEVAPGGISISRIIAVTENNFYKFPKTAVDTGVVPASSKFPLSLLRQLIIKDEEGSSVEFCFEKGTPQAGFCLQFRESRQKKEFLLAICHINPNIPITSKRLEAKIASQGQENDITYKGLDPTAEDKQRADPLAAFFERKELPPIPPKPVMPDTNSELSVFRDRSVTGELSEDQLGDIVRNLVSKDISITSKPEARSPDYYDDTRENVAASYGVSATRNTITGVPPRQSINILDDDLGSLLYPDSNNEVETTLTTNCLVEVRDSDSEPWQEGTVQSIQGDPLLRSDSENPGFLLLTCMATIVKVRPQGSDKAFSWRQIRLPREAELARRHQERQTAEALAKKTLEEEEERKNIRRMIDSMEMRLQQGLRELSEDREETTHRIASRQRDNDPRIRALKEQMYKFDQSTRSEDQKIKSKRTQMRQQFQKVIDDKRDELLIENKLQTSDMITPPRNVTADIQLKTAASRVLQEQERQQLAGDGSPYSGDALLAVQRQDFADVQKQLDALTDSYIGKHLPDDKLLLGKTAYDQYKRWRSTGGLLSSEGVWTDRDTRQLLQQLKTVHSEMIRSGAKEASVARVQRIIGNLDRERRIIANKNAPTREHYSPSPRRQTIPVPFKLSKGSKPLSSISAEDFKRELSKEAKESQRILNSIRATCRRSPKSSSVKRSGSSKERPEAPREPSHVDATPPSVKEIDREIVQQQQQQVVEVPKLSEVEERQPEEDNQPEEDEQPQEDDQREDDQQSVKSDPPQEIENEDSKSNTSAAAPEDTQQPEQEQEQEQEPLPDITVTGDNDIDAEPDADQQEPEPEPEQEEQQDEEIA